MTSCFSCGARLELRDRVGRSERCPHCQADIHSCRMCSFYDRTVYNECRESQAERVVEKEKSNFCDYFQLAVTAKSSNGVRDAAKAREALKALFAKKER